MRLIDADEAYKVLTDYYHHGTEIQHKALKEAIERVPTVDIDAITESHEMIGYDRGFRDGYAQATSEVRHGHWIEGTKVHPDLMNDSTYNYECSECGYWDQHGANVEVPYCWHCGCKMDEVAE